MMAMRWLLSYQCRLLQIDGDTEYCNHEFDSGPGLANEHVEAPVMADALVFADAAPQQADGAHPGTAASAVETPRDLVE